MTQTEVYINGLLIDIDESETIAATYGNVDFGKLSKRSGTKSNNYVVPFSQRNKLVFEGSEIAGSWSDVPYRKATIRVDISGVTVFEGWCMLNESKDGYEILSFADASDFNSIITSHKIVELDLSLYNHVWNEAVIQGSWNNDSGYMYAYVEYNKFFLSNNVAPDYLMPQIYFKDIVKAIVAYAGYEIFGKVLTDEVFTKHVIVPCKYPKPFEYGANVTLNGYLPDLLMSKVWLDFANIYGLMFIIDDQTKEITATYIDDLLFNEHEEWSNKVDRTETTRTNYRFSSYAQRSYLRYAAFKAPFADGDDFAKEVLIDDLTLKDTADIYKSEFGVIQDETFLPGLTNAYGFNAKPAKSFIGVWNAGTIYNGQGNDHVWYYGTYYRTILAGSNKLPSSEPTYWEAALEKDIWEFITRSLYGILEYDPVATRTFQSSIGDVVIPYKVDNDQLDWEYIYPRRYRVFDRATKKTKVVEMLMKLNYTDINQLDFTRIKVIDGESYMLQEITQFKINEDDSTTVNLVRI